MDVQSALRPRTTKFQAATIEAYSHLMRHWLLLLLAVATKHGAPPNHWPMTDVGTHLETRPAISTFKLHGALYMHIRYRKNAVWTASIFDIVTSFAASACHGDDSQPKKTWNFRKAPEPNHATLQIALATRSTCPNVSNRVYKRSPCSSGVNNQPRRRLTAGSLALLSARVLMTLANLLHVPVWLHKVRVSAKGGLGLVPGEAVYICTW